MKDSAGGPLRRAYSLFSRIPDRHFLPLLLAAAGAGAALLQPRYYVGFFNDDAAFVLLAQGLLDHLRALSPAGFGSAFSHFLPGYPVFLAPFAAAFGPHWGWLRWTTAALSLLSVYGLWRLLEGWLSMEERRWAVLFYAVHPLFLLSSGMVMADPFLACLFIYGLLGLRLALEDEKGWRGCALLLAASAWACATKPIGLLLPAALTAALAAAGARRALKLTAVFFWLPCLAAAAVSLLGDKSPTDYVTYMLQGLASLAGQPLWARGYGLLHAFVLVYGLGWFWPRGPVADLLGAALIAGLVYLCLKGLAALLAKPRPGRFVAMAAGLLLLGQGLVMSLWTVYSERYALPMLPFWLLFLAAGLGASWRSRPWAARTLMAGLAAGFAVHAAGLALETRSGRAPAESRFCERTLDWIRRETPPGSRFVGEASLVHLYTGRAGAGLLPAPNFDVFLLKLREAGITHALVTGQAVLSTKGSYGNDHARQKGLERAWIRSHPRYFSRLYADRDEGTEVYAFSVPPARARAEESYARALRELKANDPAAAAASLRLALEGDPDFASALVTLAVVKVRGGGDAAEAERLLRRALAAEPNFQGAAKLLAELLARQGRKRAAAQDPGVAAQAAPPFEAGP